MFLFAAVLPLLVPPAEAALKGKVTASSFATVTEGKTVKLMPDLAADGLLATAWADGAAGGGGGAWLELDLGAVRDIQEVNLWPGDLSEGKKSFREYSRPRTVRVSLTGGSKDVSTELVLEDRIQRADIPLAGNGRKVRVEVVDVFEGIVYPNLRVAEVGVDFNQSAGELEDLTRWLQSDAALKADDAHTTAVKEMWTRCNDAQFGDEEAFGFLVGQASDGPDYLREQARRLVDVGFRVAAIRPSPVALDALQKLKDPNAIPAIEMAKLRSWRKNAAALDELIEIFYAYQEFIGGERVNLPYWGTTGWEIGALKSYGEPMALEVDRDGTIWVADVGNNRVQFFGDNGRALGQLGPEADLAKDWFTEGRAWYVSGARPGKEPGTFVNPLDVELIPQKEEDWVAVLDAASRVQLFDNEGRQLIGWTVDADVRIDPGVGGEGYLVWVPKRRMLIVIVGQVLVAYNLDGEELARAELEDGTPNAAELSPKGKLLLAFGRQVVRYDLDGYRWGTELDDTVLDAGYEDLDLTLDEEGKLWVVTDKGFAYKMKGVKKIDYRVQISEISLESPRIAVQDEVIYCVDRDRIITLDAAQKRLDEEAAAEDAG